MAQILQVMGHIPESLDLIHDEEKEEERVEEMLIDSLPIQRGSPQQPAHDLPLMNQYEQTASLSLTESLIASSNPFPDTSDSTSLCDDGPARVAAAAESTPTVATASSSPTLPTPEVVSVRAFEQNLGHLSQGASDATSRKCQTETPRNGDVNNDIDDGEDNSTEPRTQTKKIRPNAILISANNGAKSEDGYQSESRSSEGESLPKHEGCHLNGVERSEEEMANVESESGKTAKTSSSIVDEQKSPAESGE